MFRWLFLLIIIVPALEIGLFVWAGSYIGPWWIILLIISTGVVGAWLARKQGLETIRNVQTSMSRGQMPQDALLDGACILIGAAFLLTPGFITDAAGFGLLLPVTRGPIKHIIRGAIQKALQKGTVTIYRR
ncbi:FxsA family protein [Halobacillus sp. ACCC02827]|uniref:FxsA family protein n=1 Tax=Bacillaceae TaxID=186817 RepID=UPI0002A4F80B|nr:MULTISPECIES: FxsA family protein [Bacillaceae]ELK47284.1 FxsA protein [Halobacillus sp. BAB-2008]QHT47399.1 membrane protein FxsA [Bacillus sp. SB49]WJE14622.1 FxsA family protein [Halobacillus sp. ACCC02827]